MNKFIHYHSSLENHTRFQTKLGKVYTLLSGQKGPKSPPVGAAHTYMAYIREYPLGVKGSSRILIEKEGWSLEEMNLGIVLCLNP